MVDYKEMYYKMVRETEKAIRVLAEVQRECEEMYMNSEEQGEDKVLE